MGNAERPNKVSVQSNVYSMEYLIEGTTKFRANLWKRKGESTRINVGTDSKIPS